MGVCIYYQGVLRDMNRLFDLTMAVRAKCREWGWPHRFVNERIVGTMEILVDHGSGGEDWKWEWETRPVDDRWRGIVVNPPDCETLYLTFGRDGRLIAYKSAPDRQPGHYIANDLLYVKTQFGGPERHIGICTLLRLLEEYGVELEVHDDSRYWETGDREQLAHQMEIINNIIRLLAQESQRLAALVLGEEAEDLEVLGVEVGKVFREPKPEWRREWGISAEEN